MPRTLFVDSVAGIAGNMFAAGFVDAGLIDADLLRIVPHALAVDATVEIEKRTTAAMASTYLHVQLDVGTETPSELILHPHQDQARFVPSYVDMDKRLAAAKLSDAAIAFARACLRTLAEAEAAAHGVALEEVHFHEIGAADTLVDLAMAAVCVTTVSPKAVVASPVKLGRGYVSIQHGTHPIPPPASLRLVEGLPVAPMPHGIVEDDIELSTPTGLAILRTMEPRFLSDWPPGIVLAAGTGCGSIDLKSFPNVVRIALVEDGAHPAGLSDYLQDSVIEIAANIDDDTPEHLAWLTEALRARGALDVWLTPQIGKKGRLGQCLSILAADESWELLASFVLENSTTLGLRYRAWDRVKLDVEWEVVEVEGRPVRMKIGRTKAGTVVKSKPEADDMSEIWKASFGDEHDRTTQRVNRRRDD